MLQNNTEIGLHIIKGHLDNLGETINFKNNEGVGTIFMVELYNYIITLR